MGRQQRIETLVMVQGTFPIYVYYFICLCRQSGPVSPNVVCPLSQLVNQLVLMKQNYRMK